VLRTVYQFFSVSLDTTNAYGNDNDGGVTPYGSVTSNAVTVTVSGGTAPYTYAWEYVDGSIAVVPVAPTSASTTFTATVGSEYPTIAIYRCKVTDANGEIIYTANVNIQLEWYY
jgi:hypothetical protein